MAKSSSGPRVVILGMGNLLLWDEGVGVHIARALKERLPQGGGLEVIDGGTSPEVAYLIGEPGAIYRFPPELFEEYAPISLHGLGVGDTLRIMELMGAKPRETVIIGVEPKDIGWRLGLSPELEARVAKLLEVVMAEIGMTLEEKDVGLGTEALA